MPQGAVTVPGLRSALAHIFTWNTVNKLCTNVSKLLRGLASVESKLNLPPKTCIPRRAKMTIKRKRSSSREAMDWMELRRDATRLERERQYLKHGTETHNQRAAHRPAARRPVPLTRPGPARPDFTGLVIAQRPGSDTPGVAVRANRHWPLNSNSN